MPAFIKSRLIPVPILCTKISVSIVNGEPKKFFLFTRLPPVGDPLRPIKYDDQIEFDERGRPYSLLEGCLAPPESDESHV